MKILVPIDQSQYSQVALEFIRAKGANFGAHAEVIVINVHPVSFFDTLIGHGKADETFREEAMEFLVPAVEKLRAAGINARAVYESGSNIAKVIDEVAEKEKVDMIVMGAQGMSSVQGIIFGSVTNSLLATTYEPMLVLHDKPVSFRDSPYIGIAVDGSPYADSAVDFVAKHMNMFGGVPRIYFINVVERPAPGQAYRPLEKEEAAEHKEFMGEVFEGAEEKLRAAGAECVRIKLTGDEPGDALAAFAEKEDLDLVVIGTRGLGAFQATVMGSTSTRFAAMSDRPQLIIQTDESAAN